jgi:hypothetical protein
MLYFFVNFPIHSEITLIVFFLKHLKLLLVFAKPLNSIQPSAEFPIR